MEIKVYATAAAIPAAQQLAGRTAVVIDVLRATTTIAVALAAGARDVRPVLTPEAAVAAAQTDGQPALLGGERGGLRIPGFDLGNSPLEYTAAAVSGRRVVLTTTNGTRALHRAAAAVSVCTAAFVNLSAVTAFVQARGQDVAICCAGTYDEFSLDDALCAGALCHQLADGGPVQMCDLGRAMAELFRSRSGAVHELLRTCIHGQRLLHLGFAADLELCATIDGVAVVPVLADGILQPDRR